MRKVAPIKDITDALRYHEVAEAYYYRNWNFLNINFDFKDIVDFKVIPMSDKALSFISHGYIEHIGKGIKINAEYPYKSYRLGFIEEYQKPIEGDLTTEEGRNWSILRHIQPTHEPPEISYRNFENEWEAYFSEEKAEEYGTYMARSYKAWEFLVNHLPFYEKFFITKQEEDLEGLPVNVLKKAYKEHKDLWKPISQDDFIKLFDRKINPSLKLKPIEGKKGEVRSIFNVLCQDFNIKNRTKYLDARIDASKQNGSDYDKKMIKFDR